MTGYPLMLAQPSDKDPELAIRQLQRTGDWTFEFKYDGVRALVIIDHGSVQIINRNGRDITHRYPDVVDRLRPLPLRLVLDGEIICLDENGRPDFSRIHRRDAQESPRAIAALAKTLPAQLVAFDALESGGVDNRLLSYTQRRLYLTDRTEELAAAGVVVPPVSKDGETMWKVVADMGLEGLVAKRDGSTYSGRRSGAWVKIKRKHRISALVSGYDPGEGHRAATFGCLHLSLLEDDGQLVQVGSVGTGFTDADCTLITKRLRDHDHPIIVEVEYLELSPDRRLRQPSFKGVRTDVTVDDCTVHQLDIHPTG